jgi:ParB family transcriptional regulator, chromosome partitioning protein
MAQTGQESPQANRKLGRGLANLLNAAPVSVVPPSATTSAAPIETQSTDDRVVFVDVSDIVPSPYQPRRVFSDVALQQLADSVMQSGIMQPILVRKVGGKYELIAGERRWRAAKVAKLPKIPTIVKALSDEETAEWALVENIQREDLNAMDRAVALKGLMQRFGLTQEAIAKKVGLDRSSVANLIRLNDLEPQITSLIAEAKLSAGHGKALLAMPAGDARVNAATLAANFGWSVRRLEQAGQDAANAIEEAKTESPEQRQRNAVLRDLERQIGQHLGTKVSILTDANGKRGRMIVEFYGLDHFDGLLTKLGMHGR